MCFEYFCKSQMATTRLRFSSWSQGQVASAGIIGNIWYVLAVLINLALSSGHNKRLWCTLGLVQIELFFRPSREEYLHSSAFKLEYLNKILKSYTWNKRLYFYFRLNFKMSPIISCLKTTFRRAEVKGGELRKSKVAIHLFTCFYLHAIFSLCFYYHSIVCLKLCLYINGQDYFRIILNLEFSLKNIIL